jgi:FKBP-type peptidyl-prolyl cis-trans isomerase SlyD
VPRLPGGAEIRSTGGPRSRIMSAMSIAAGKVVNIAYTLKDDAGKVLDTSDGKKPLEYLHGTGAIVPGLEKALEGKDKGAVVEVSLAPEEAYGRRDDTLIRNIPTRRLGKVKPEVGRRYQIDVQGGVMIVLVKAIKGDYVTVDPNHPLADMNLHFKVEVVAVRDATPEEMAHGHSHGEGHHHH